MERRPGGRRRRKNVGLGLRGAERGAAENLRNGLVAPVPAAGRRQRPPHGGEGGGEVRSPGHQTTPRANNQSSGPPPDR